MSDQLQSTKKIVKSNINFENIWQGIIFPLKGKKVYTFSGKENFILDVDFRGLERISSHGKASRIEIGLFRYAINKILTKGSITRKEIDQYSGYKRVSSGVIAVLSKVPYFEVSRTTPVTIYLKQTD